MLPSFHPIPCWSSRCWSSGVLLGSMCCLVRPVTVLTLPLERALLGSLLKAAWMDFGFVAFCWGRSLGLLWTFFLQQPCLSTFLLGYLGSFESSLHFLGPRHDFNIGDRYCPHYTNGQWLKIFPVQPPSQLPRLGWDWKPLFFCCPKALWI